jgi:LPS O-antigen subunit length determinant protein (WzzB/FepE family)
MMTSETLRQKTAERLRMALASHAYDDAQAALDNYRELVEAAVAAHPAGAPPPAELAREVNDLIEWALRVVRVARAQTRDQLDQVSAALRYFAPASHVQTWKMDG